jgi:hypothetical protein
MAETVSSLEGLSALKPAAADAPRHVQKLDKQGRAYATGKRKDAVARVWVKPGSGKITVNDRTLEVYFARPVLRMLLKQPLVLVGRDTQYDINVAWSSARSTARPRPVVPSSSRSADPLHSFRHGKAGPCARLFRWCGTSGGGITASGRACRGRAPWCRPRSR